MTLPALIETPTTEVVERFMQKVHVAGDCWEWIGVKSHHGYGQFRCAGKTRYAHRISYVIHVGPIPPGMFIDHRCHNRSCVNPNHLRVVTKQANCQNRSDDSTNAASGVRGVYWAKWAKRWRAEVHVNDRKIHVGYFATKEEAAAGVLAARMKHYELSDGR
jgi:hypothetical protein